MPSFLGSRRVLHTPFAGVGYPVGTIYVSKSATNGFAVGSDSNTLAQAKAVDRQTPFATIKQAFAQASNGDLVVINDGSYSGTELDASLGYLNMTGKLVSFRAHRAGQVTMLGTNSTRIVRVLNMTAGMAATFTGIIFDAANTAQHCIEDGDANNALHTLTFVNCQTVNPTVRGLSLACTKVIVNLIGHTHTAGASRSLLYTTTLASGSQINIVGGSTTISQQNNGQGVIEARATEAGASVSIAGHTLDSTLLSSLTSTGTHDGIAIYNASSVSITGNTVAVRGAPGARKAAGIRVSQTSAIAVTPTISGNTVTNETTGGYGILAGTDGTGTGDGYVIDPVANDNIISGIPANQATPVHGILLGFNVGGQVLRNRVYGCGLALIQKKNLTSGALFAANTVRLSAFATVGYSIAMYGKGSLNTRFVNNSVYVNDASANNSYIQHVQPDDVSGTNATGIEFTNNAIYFTGTAAVKFVNVAASQAVTFSNNLYYSPAALPASCFGYQGSTYSSVAAWAAAQEASAVSADPKFTDAANDNFVLLSGSGCIGAGVTASGVTTDKAGRAYALPPAIGAHEYAA